MGITVRIPEMSQGVGQVERVHVEALPILDDLMEKHFLLPRRLYPAGDFGKACVVGGMVAALAGDDAVDVLGVNIAHGYRLDDAQTLHGGVEFLLGIGVEPAPGLTRVGADAVQRDGKGPTQTPAAVQ